MRFHAPPRGKTWLFAYLLWIVIAFPYAFAASPALSHVGFWRADRFGLASVVIALTGAVGVTGFSVLPRGRALADGLIGFGAPALFFSVAIIPGPGIVWGVVMGRLLSKARIPLPSNEIA